jgi:cytochrome c2
MKVWTFLLAALAVSPGVALAQTTDQDGERAFQRCYSCHSVQKGENGLSGPNLRRLGQRPIAGDRTFVYSKAFNGFAASNPRWTPDLLDRFLTDPEALVPGNQMGFFGLRKAEERAAIIAYLLGEK